MKLLITVPWDPELMARVKHAFPQIRFVTALSKADMLREIEDAEVVFGKLDRDSFRAARKLRWVQCQGAGVESLVCIPELVESDVLLTNTRGAHAATIAEHFFGMLMMLAKRFAALREAQERREWVRWEDWRERLGPEPVGLLGLTLGIIGLGNIGRAIAERGSAFGMRVIAVDVCDVPRPACISGFSLLDGLPELLWSADAVAVAVPGTPQTAGMLGEQSLALMKPTAYLCVLSRGGIVDEQALARMLCEGRLAGAGLDVAETEPLPPANPLWTAPNTIITPHCAGRSRQTTKLATDIFQENLEHYLAREPLVNLVDKRRGW